MKPRISAWINLLRLPNALTLPGDVWVGLAWAGLAPAEAARPLLITLCLYLAGMVLNDCCDQARDRVHRPERPLPSGAIPPAAAWTCGLTLLAAGLLLAARTSPATHQTALLLAVAIVVYDGFARTLPVLGPVVMGICRALSVTMGVSLGCAAPVLSFPALLWLAYIAAVTHLAQRETRNVPPGTMAPFLPLLALAGVFGMILHLPPPTLNHALPAVVTGATLVTALAALARVLHRNGRVRPENIGQALRALFLLQAFALFLLEQTLPAVCVLLFGALHWQLRRRVAAS